MQQECTIPTASTRETVPPVVCATWCHAADGHPDALYPAEQTCIGQTQQVELSREKPVAYGRSLDDGRRRFWPSRLNLGLFHDRFDREPIVSVDHNDDAGVTLTLDEADQLAQTLLELVRTGRKSGQR